VLKELSAEDLLTSEEETEEEILREYVARQEGRESLAGYTRYVLGLEPAKHHLLFCSALDRVISGESRRLIISAPPGSAKSTYASVALPAYALAKLPKGERFVSASYSKELALEQGRKVRNLIDSEEHSILFPDSIVSANDRSANRFSTTKGTAYYSTGVGGSITGKRATILSMDDLIKGRQQADSKGEREKVWSWYLSDAFTRLFPHGRIVFIMTRWHEEDPIGKILDQAQKSGEQWEYIRIEALCDNPAEDPLGRKLGEPYWPEWESKESLLSKKEGIGPREWACLYQQRPSPQEGTQVLRSWFKKFKPNDLEGVPLIFYDSYDTASKIEQRNDPTVRLRFAVDPTGNVYLWEIEKKKVEFTDLVKLFSAAAVRRTRGQTISSSLIEDKGTGTSLIQSVKKSHNVIPCTPESEGDKAFRFEAASDFFEAGRFYYNSEDPLAADYIEELVTFPGGKHDDMVDATSQFISWVKKKAGRRGSGKLRH